MFRTNYIYIYINIHIHTHIYIYTYIHAYINTYIHTQIHKYIHTCTHIYTYTYVYIHKYNWQMKHNVIISMRASHMYENTPYRRIIQKEMKRIAPIVLFVKGSITKKLLQSSVGECSVPIIYIYI